MTENNEFKAWSEAIPGDVNHKYHMCSYRGIVFCKFPYSPYMGDHVGPYGINIHRSNLIGGKIGWMANISKAKPNRPGYTDHVKTIEGYTLEEVVRASVDEVMRLTSSQPLHTSDENPQGPGEE